VILIQEQKTKFVSLDSGPRGAVARTLVTRLGVGPQLHSAQNVISITATIRPHSRTNWRFCYRSDIRYRPVRVASAL